MATTTEVFKVEIEGQERAVGSMKDLKAAIKDAQNSVIAGTPGANKALAQLRDKMDDVKESAMSVQGEGVEPLRNSFALFKDGLANMDLGKMGMAFKGLGAAMKAVPIFLLVEGITYLITNFKELSEGTGLLAKVLQPVGDLVEWLTNGLYSLTDAIGLTNSALDEMGESTVKNAEASKEALSSQNAEYDRQIAVAKAAGKSTTELEKAKQQSIIETNKLLVEQTIAWVRMGGVLDDEKKKLLTAQLEAIKNAKTQEKLIDLTHQKEQTDKYKAHLDEKAKLDKEYNDEFKRRLDLTVQSQIENEEREKKAIKEKQQEELDALTQSHIEGEAEVAYQNSLTQKKADKKVETIQWTKEQEKAAIQESFAVAKLATENQAQLANFLFDLKRSKLQKGSAEELKVAKQQFKINKALAIQSTIISGIQGVVNALSAQSVIPEPFGTVLKVITAAGIGVAAGVNVAKIASQQFSESGSGGGGGATASVGSLGSAASAAPPVPSINTPQNTPSTTSFDSDGKNLNAIPKTQVVETELTATQRDVKRINEQATF